jgi:hypothetical protein
MMEREPSVAVWEGGVGVGIEKYLDTVEIAALSSEVES